MFEFNKLNPGELELEIDIIKKFQQIDAKIKINNSAVGITAEFNVQFIADLTCVRCLDKFSRKFNTNLHLNYVKGKDPYAKIEKINLKTTDIDHIYYTGSQIDLKIGIREAVMFSLPIAPLCKEQCLGLCPVCGKNKNKKKCKCKIEKAGLFTPIPKRAELKRKRSKKR